MRKRAAAPPPKSTNSKPTSPLTPKNTTMSDPNPANANDPHQALLGQDSRTSKATTTTSPSSEAPLTTTDTTPKETEAMENLSQKSQWIVLAIASGCCAAFNGVFAKLTTTELTTTFATWIANLIHLSNIEGGVEVVVRAIFFILNLIFNGIMWTLFTKALARGSSTTKVSILNTSSNFMVTAVLGALIFSESLPPLWFLGAALLVVGNVIIGRRDEGEKADGEGEGGRGDHGNANGSGNGEGEGLLGDEIDLAEDLREREVERRRKMDEIRREQEDILHLDESVGEREARDDLQLL